MGIPISVPASEDGIALCALLDLLRDKYGLTDEPEVPDQDATA